MTPLAILAAAAVLLPTLTLGATPALAPPDSTPARAPSAGIDRGGGGATPAGQWAWPLVGRPEVVRGFAVGPAPWSPGHRGVDLAARPGAAVHSPAAGVVRFAGLVAGRPVLVIDQGGGLVSSFEPVVTGLRTGATVRRGGFVGAVAIGRGHCFPGTCLHWGVRRNGVYIDPLDLVAGRIGPPVLLPVLSAEAR